MSSWADILEAIADLCYPLGLLALALIFLFLFRSQLAELIGRILYLKVDTEGAALGAAASKNADPARVERDSKQLNLQRAGTDSTSFDAGPGMKRQVDQLLELKLTELSAERGESTKILSLGDRKGAIQFVASRVREQVTRAAEFIDSTVIGNVAATDYLGSRGILSRPEVATLKEYLSLTGEETLGLHAPKIDAGRAVEIFNAGWQLLEAVTRRFFLLAKVSRLEPVYDDVESTNALGAEAQLYYLESDLQKLVGSTIWARFAEVRQEDSCEVHFRDSDASESYFKKGSATAISPDLKVQLTRLGDAPDGIVRPRRATDPVGDLAQPDQG